MDRGDSTRCCPVTVGVTVIRKMHPPRVVFVTQFMDLVKALWEAELHAGLPGVSRAGEKRMSSRRSNSTIKGPEAGTSPCHPHGLPLVSPSLPCYILHGGQPAATCHRGKTMLKGEVRPLPAVLTAHPSAHKARCPG